METFNTFHNENGHHILFLNWKLSYLVFKLTQPQNIKPPNHRVRNVTAIFKISNALQKKKA